MTEIEILCKYDEAVTSFAAGLAAGLLDKEMEDEFKEQYELFKAGRDALREKQEREKGCEFCQTDNEGYSTILPRKGIGRAYIMERFVPHRFVLMVSGPHGTHFEVAIHACPMCGRPLSET